MSTITLSTTHNAVMLRVLPKIVSSVLLALIITLALFFMMQQLITPANQTRAVVEAVPVIQLYERPDDSSVVVKKTMPEQPDLTPPDLPRSSVEPVDTHSTFNTSHFTPNVTVDNSLPAPPSQGFGNKQATPLVRVEPRFPTDAARQGISGWVMLSFSIDETGAVTDITVLNAEPRNMFDREAIRALRRWKYQPQVVDGKAIKQHNLQVQLDFQLAQEP